MANNFNRDPTNQGARPDPIVKDMLFTGWRVTVTGFKRDVRTQKDSAFTHIFESDAGEKVGMAVLTAIRTTPDPHGFRVIMDKLTCEPILESY